MPLHSPNISFGSPSTALFGTTPRSGEKTSWDGPDLSCWAMCYRSGQDKDRGCGDCRRWKVTSGRLFTAFLPRAEQSPLLTTSPSPDQDGPIAYGVQHTLAGCCLTRHMKVQLLRLAQRACSYGNTSRVVHPGSSSLKRSLMISRWTPMWLGGGAGHNLQSLT